MSSAKTMCLVQVGLLSVVMPVEKGLQLVRLLQSALHAEADWSEDRSLRDGPRYLTSPLRELNMTTIPANRLRDSEKADEDGKRPKRRSAASRYAEGSTEGQA